MTTSSQLTGSWPDRPMISPPVSNKPLPHFSSPLLGTSAGSTPSPPSSLSPMSLTNGHSLALKRRLDSGCDSNSETPLPDQECRVKVVWNSQIANYHQNSTPSPVQMTTAGQELGSPLSQMTSNHTLQQVHHQRHTQCTQCESLWRKIEELHAENAALREQLMAACKELPAAVNELKSLINSSSSLLSNSNSSSCFNATATATLTMNNGDKANHSIDQTHPQHHPAHHPPQSQQPPAGNCAGPTPAKKGRKRQQHNHHQQQVNGVNGNHLKALDSKEWLPEPVSANCDLVKIGLHTAISKEDYDRIDWTSNGGKKAVKDLCVAVFGRFVLSTHSLSGRASNAFSSKAAKPQLDPLKVSDIINIVTSRVKISESECRAAITAKCNEEDQRRQRKLQNYYISNNGTGNGKGQGNQPQNGGQQLPAMNGTGPMTHPQQLTPPQGPPPTQALPLNQAQQPTQSLTG